MKCPVCVKNGEKSTLHGGHGSITAAYYQPYYDEDGNYHHHDGNTRTAYYSCSNGHEFIIRGHSSCPSYPANCDFQATENLEVIEPKGFEL